MYLYKWFARGRLARAPRASPELPGLPSASKTKYDQFAFWAYKIRQIRTPTYKIREIRILGLQNTTTSNSRHTKYDEFAFQPTKYHKFVFQAGKI